MLGILAGHGIGAGRSVVRTIGAQDADPGVEDATEVCLGACAGAGAAAGGYAGKQVQQDMQNNDVESQNRRVCKTVQQQKERTLGYDVRYLLNGELKTIRMDQKPAEKILIKDGQVIAATLQASS